MARAYMTWAASARVSSLRRKRGVAEQVRQGALGPGLGVKPGAQAGGGVQLARIGGQGLELGVKRVQGLFPGGIVRVHAGQVPLVLLLDLGAFFQCFGHGYLSFLCYSGRTGWPARPVSAVQGRSTGPAGAAAARRCKKHCTPSAAKRQCAGAGAALLRAERPRRAGCRWAARAAGPGCYAGVTAPGRRPGSRRCARPRPVPARTPPPAGRCLRGSACR